MALFSISMGIICFLVAIAWSVFVTLYSQSSDSGFSFSIILAMFPAFLGMLLIIPATLYRLIDVISKNESQTLREKRVLVAGILISVLYCTVFIMLALS
ncbi:hypothetical protein [Thalassotalea piscium]|uniref:Asparagine N-glycosylation enzyme membrane subunit Stt3 n=1 Tax=Thalassotalea piscium TaxID=1230533 RepID=A0A7X0TTS4_9GAMM|nr:hypothetical protein [Thalassotalea piscium]MBB6543448.1 asparagine N-glycosylation enzyme membrane subunit Stt3 [Thalassotalea piscium]